MRSRPSVKRLVETFQLSTNEAKLIRQLATLTDDSEPREKDQLELLIDQRCPQTSAYARSCDHDPYTPYIWRVTLALHAIDVIVKGHGVEGLGPPRRGDYAPPYEYINFGDPYATTLIYRRLTDRLFIGCWGDIAEKHPNW